LRINVVSVHLPPTVPMCFPADFQISLTVRQRTLLLATADFQWRRLIGLVDCDAGAVLNGGGLSDRQRSEPVGLAVVALTRKS